MKKGMIILLAVLAIIVIIVIGVVGIYNGLVKKSENVDNKFADIDTMLQRRMDLIPNLVNTVKGFAAHETEIMANVTEARTKLAGATTVEEKAKANAELSGALSRLLVVVENYPDLKSSANFIQLADELAGTENRIAVSRKDYNDAVKEYNTDIKKMPNSIIAGMFKFDEKVYFEAKEGADVVPEVKF